MAEIFAHHVDAEWRTDWAEAVERCASEGREATIADLARTEPQRRADALLALARRAASGGAGRAALPTMNVLIDAATLESAVTGEPIAPAQYRDVVCRTQGGALLDPHQAAGMALWARLRRVVHDGAGLVLELGRRRRLFTGASRDAALLMSTTCVWPGCGCSIRNTEVDHAVEWRAHGATVPRNGVPLCKRHHLHKERHRFAVRREADGRWTVLDPSGQPIG